MWLILQSEFMLTDLLVGWYGLKMFLNWPKLESQLKVALSWCHTAVASMPLLGCWSSVVYTWKEREWCNKPERNHPLPWLKKKKKVQKSKVSIWKGLIQWGGLGLKKFCPIQWLNGLDKWKRSCWGYWLWYLGMRNLYVIICAGVQNHDECLI